MTLAHLRDVLRSNAPVVLTEAAAGCGKTHEASLLAAELAQTLGAGGGGVLVLAHTNAAVQEFRSRTEGVGGNVRATTIDALCLDLVAPYASALGLPPDLRRRVGPGAGRVQFDALSEAAVRLLSRNPSIAQMVGERYPVIIADEHQDARKEQHHVLRILAEAGRARLRIFGDPLQAIYDDGNGIGWDQLEREADARLLLETPHRWSQNPELGDWIMLARSALKAGAPLPLRSRPGCVRVTTVAGMPDAAFGKGDQRFLSAPLQAFLNRHERGTAAVLAATRNLTLGLFSCGRGRVRMNEGADFEAAYSALEAAVTAIGKPQELCKIIINLVSQAGTGFTSAHRHALDRALSPNELRPGRGHVLAPLMLAFAAVYRSPDLAGFCSAIEHVARKPPEWLNLREQECLRVLARIRPVDADDAFGALDAAVNARKRSPVRPARTVGTIHKSKGLEFDNVLVANCSETHFSGTRGRRLAYVALSRARLHLELLVPGLAPSSALFAAREQWVRS